MCLDLGFDADASRAAAADEAAAGGPGVSGPLLLDLAGFAEAVPFDSNLDFIGVGSIFGAWSPLATDTGLLLISFALLPFFLTGCSPAGGGGGGGGGQFALTVISLFRCADLPRGRNLLIVSRRLGFVFIAAAPAPGGGGGGRCCWGSVVRSIGFFFRTHGVSPSAFVPVCC